MVEKSWSEEAMTSERNATGLLTFLTTIGGIAGTEGQAVGLAMRLDRSKFAVQLACMHRFGPLLDEIERNGIPILHYPVDTFRHPRILALQVRLAREIRRRKIEIVHSYGFYSNVFAIPAAKLAGARVIASIRDMGVYMSPRQRMAQRVMCRMADRILVNATAIQEWLIADGYERERITVIPNGIDTARLGETGRAATLREELKLDSDTPLIGVLGRVTAMKGLDDFLHAAVIVLRQFPNARFLIVGNSGTFYATPEGIVEDKSYERALEQLATELGIRDKVIFTGFRSDVAHVLDGLSISLQPSRSEGMSNTLLESMAAGAPVVATRVGGAPEVLRDGENGLLVAPGDVEAIAAAMCRLLAAPSEARAMGRAARTAVLEKYSMDRVVERTTHLYNSLLRHKRPQVTVASERGLTGVQP